MYFRSLGTKYRPASPRLTARFCLQSRFWSQNTHILYSFDLYLALNRNKTLFNNYSYAKENISQRCFGSAGASELCTVWLVCAVAQQCHTFHKPNCTDHSIQKFNQNLPVVNQIKNSGNQQQRSNKWFFAPPGGNGFSILRDQISSSLRANGLPFVPRFWNPKHSFRDLLSCI